jgi:hypothetical protein
MGEKKEIICALYVGIISCISFKAVDGVSSTLQL